MSHSPRSYTILLQLEITLHLYKLPESQPCRQHKHIYFRRTCLLEEAKDLRHMFNSPSFAPGSVTARAVERRVARNLLGCGRKTIHPSARCRNTSRTRRTGGQTQMSVPRTYNIQCLCRSHYANAVATQKLNRRCAVTAPSIQTR